MSELLTPADIERMAADAGLTMNQVFQRAAVAHTTFYRWKSGKTSPSLQVYRRLAEAVRPQEAA